MSSSKIFNTSSSGCSSKTWLPSEMGIWNLTFTPAGCSRFQLPSNLGPWLSHFNHQLWGWLGHFPSNLSSMYPICIFPVEISLKLAWNKKFGPSLSSLSPKKLIMTWESLLSTERQCPVHSEMRLQVQISEIHEEITAKILGKKQKKNIPRAWSITRSRRRWSSSLEHQESHRDTLPKTKKGTISKGNVPLPTSNHQFLGFLGDMLVFWGSDLSFPTPKTLKKMLHGNGV